MSHAGDDLSSYDLGNWVRERIGEMQSEARAEFKASKTTEYIRPVWMCRAAAQVAQILSTITYRLERYSGIPA